MRTLRVAGLVALAALAGRAQAGLLDEARKTDPAQLSVEVQRTVLANGLVLVLAPDPTAAGVAVWMTFRAGALREPAGKTGLAHLVEHLLASGTTPETDYATILEARRARALNAETGFDTMTFRAVVPAEELPVALWAEADRLGTLAPRLDARAVERERRIVEQERALRLVDAPYGLVHEQLYRRLYPGPHPLRGGVIGVPGELATVGVEDVRRFVEAYLVPANAVLVLCGRFDPAEARALVASTLGRLPGGRPAPRAALPGPGEPFVDARTESRARRPRVTLAWRVRGAGREEATALSLGAQLLTFLVDGAWGMEIGAGVVEYEGEALFQMQLTVPYDEPMEIVHRDADGFLRLLTHKEMPLDFMIAANLALDRFALFGLDDLGGRARALTELYRERSEQGERLAGEKSLRREVGELGGALSVEVDQDASVLGVSGYARDARRYLALLAEAVTAPRHGDESFAARRGALLDAIDELESSDPEALAQVVARAAFGAGHPYARSILGTRRSLGPLGLEDVVARQEVVLAPAGATLLVVGDVRAERVVADARKLFGGWAREAAPAPAIPPPAPPRGPFDAGMLRRQPAATLVACATRPVPDVRATDGALAVFAALLGEGARSRLALALREEGGFTYHAGAAVLRQRAARALVVCAPLAAARAGEGLRAFRATLEALRGGAPTPEELRRAKALRLAALDGTQEDVDGEAAAWTEALALGLRAPRRAEEAAEIERTTAEEVRRIAAAALRPDAIRWIFSGDPAVAARAVRENGLGRLLGLPLDR